MGGQHHAPTALPQGKSPYPLYRRLGRPQGRSGQVREIWIFDLRTTQPVASRCTDWAIPALMERTSLYHVTGGWVALRTSVDGLKKLLFFLSRIDHRFLGRLDRSAVIVLSAPTLCIWSATFCQYVYTRNVQQDATLVSWTNLLILS
jgi:hypothetical protein